MSQYQIQDHLFLCGFLAYRFLVEYFKTFYQEIQWLFLLNLSSLSNLLSFNPSNQWGKEVREESEYLWWFQSRHYLSFAFLFYGESVEISSGVWIEPGITFDSTLYKFWISYQEKQSQDSYQNQHHLLLLFYDYKRKELSSQQKILW